MQRASLAVADAAVRYRLRAGQRGAGVAAVEDISFTVRAGEFVAIVGPSGCGKSTLLKAIAGLVPLSQGEVTLEGGAAVRVGFVFQTDALLPWRTASGNIEVALRLAGARGAAVRSRASASGNQATSSRPSSRAACASASPWPARSPTIRRSS